MLKAITFLGTGKYEPVGYQFNNQSCRTCFFPAALVEFFNPQTLYICLTPEAAAHPNWDGLKTELAGKKLDLIPVEIPRGSSELELWEIFRRIAAVVETNDHLLFDITYSFRSLPMLIFLAVAYLKAAKRVTIERVVYGAYEARAADGMAPVFDLTPFVGLLDWLTAASRFIESGDAARLAALLSAAGRQGRHSAQAISDVSQAALLCQPFSLMKAVPAMLNSMEKDKQQLKATSPAFGLIHALITTEYSKFVPQNPADQKHVLKMEFDLLNWYFSNNQFIQAVNLSREWLYDMVAWRAGLPLDLNLASRTELERGVSGLVMNSRPPKKTVMHNNKSNRKVKLNETALTLQKQLSPQDQLLVTKLWDNLPDIRNAWTHAEHRQDCIAWKKALKKLQQDILPGLKQMADWLEMEGLDPPHD